MHQQFSWAVVTRPSSFLKGSAKRALVLVPLHVGLAYLAYRQAYQQQMFQSNQAFVVFIIIIVANYIMVNQLAHVVMKGRGKTITEFSIDDTHIIQADKKTPLRTLDKGAITTLIKDQELPYAEWVQDQPEQPYELGLPSSEGTVKLRFPHIEAKQKLLRSLREYVGAE